MFQETIKNYEDMERKTNAEKDRLDDKYKSVEDMLSMIRRRKSLVKAADEIYSKSCLINPNLSIAMLREVLEQIYAVLDEANDLGAFDKE